jgi:predicted outer membrane repeat protein
MYFKTVWSDYFTGNPTIQQQKEYTTTQTLSGTVHVFNCLFKSTTSGTHGGAFYCTSVTYLLVESSSFFSCRTSNSCGGAIYFNNGNGQCVLHEVCGYDCISTSTSGSSGQFVYITVNNTLSSKNYVNYSSIVCCVNELSSTYYTLWLYNGNICCPSVNISMNKCYSRPGIYCIPFYDSNSVTCSILYSTFADNIATNSICIELGTGGAKIEFKSCNIIRNTQVYTGYWGTFYTHGNVMIKDSCILENNANRIFYVVSYTLTLSKCTVDKTTSTGSFIIQNTVTKSFIHALNHMSTRNCHSEYDSAGYLTPVIQTPYPSKKKKHYYSRLSDFVSLLCVFLFHFIHSDPSVNLRY